MISLSDPRRSPPLATLDAPGGFAWWYAEILDDQRSGVVMIWSFGLPFLPGYMASARAGRPQTPRQRPSLNIALYDRGRPCFYLLRELDPADAHWDGDQSWRFGDTTLRSTLDANNRRTLDAQINCPLGHGQGHVRGWLRLTGPSPTLASPSPLPGSPHGWTPLALPAFGTVNLQLEGGRPFLATGRAYHDRNHSPLSLDALGIHTWLWGRATLPDQDRIYYVLWPKGAPHTSPKATPLCFGLTAATDGTLSHTPLTPTLPPHTTTLYGMPHWPSLSLALPDGTPWLHIHQTHRIDDGPFYLRHLTDNTTSPTDNASTLPPSPLHGTCETIHPPRIDLARHRPLVRMRVSHDHRPNSAWLPLFEGSRRGRLQRLLQHWRNP